MIESKSRLFVEGDKADSGDTTVLTVAAGFRARIYGIGITPDATLTGNVYGELGGTQITPLARKLLGGGLHQIMPFGTPYTEGADGEDVVINNSEAEDLSYIVYYDLLPS